MAVQEPPPPEVAASAASAAKAAPRWERAPVSDTASQPTEAFWEWLRATPGVDFASAGLEVASASPGPGRGVFAGKAVPSGGRIARIPASLVLSTDSVAALEPFASELAAACRRCPAEPAAQGCLDPPAVLRLWLYMIHARHRPGAPHHAYLRHCPLCLDTPLFWANEELEWLEGTSAHAVVSKERSQAWRDFAAYVRPLSQADPEHFPPDVFTLRALLWARATCTSRAFPTWMAGELADQHPSATFLLFPLLDLFNHRRGAAIEWRAAASAGGEGWEEAPCAEFRLPASAPPLEVGEEIWNDYGPKSNEVLLLDFGFCVASNAHDELELLVRCEGPLEDLRQCAAELRGRGVPVAFSHRLWLTVGPFSLRYSESAAGVNVVLPPPELIAAFAICSSWAPLSNDSLPSCDDGRGARVRKQLSLAFASLLERLPPAPLRPTGEPRRGPKGAAAQAHRRRQELCRLYVDGQRALLSKALDALRALPEADVCPAWLRGSAPGEDLAPAVGCGPGASLAVSLVLAEEEEASHDEDNDLEALLEAGAETAGQSLP